MKKLFFALVIIAVQAKILSAQLPVKDTLSAAVTTTLSVYNPETGVLQSANELLADSSLQDVEKIHPRETGMVANLGNYGSAVSDVFFQSGPSLLPQLGFASFDQVVKKIRTRPVMVSNKRYSEIKYHLGGGKEQQMAIALSQKINRSLQAGLFFQRAGSLGFLANSRTFSSAFNAHMLLNPAGKRYSAFIFSNWINTRNKLNGGIVNDSLFTNNNLSNNELGGLAVNLTNASQASRFRTVSLQQHFDLLKKMSHKDSLPGDKPRPALRLHNQSRFQRITYAYQDQVSDSLFYQHFYFGPGTYDSLRWDEFSNTFYPELLYKSNWNVPFNILRVSASYTYQHCRYHQFFDSLFTNHATGIRASLFSADSKWNSAIEWQQVIAGSHKDNHSIKWTIQFPLIRNYSLVTNATTFYDSPALIPTVYYSNHFTWQNSFERLQGIKYDVSLINKTINLAITLRNTTLSGFVYYGEAKNPVQADETIKVNQAILMKNFKWRKWNLENTLTFQQSSSPAIGLPSFNLFHSFYFESLAAGRKLKIRAGVNFYFTESYHADAFNPAMSVFYSQGDVLTQGYPLTDLFLSLKIKSAKIFFKLHNATDDLLVNNYYQVPYYSMPGRTFQMGVNWKFWE